MTRKIGLISDVHATPAPLAEALALFAREGVEAILCAGDIAGYGSDLETTVELLTKANCRTVYGNHDLWWLTDDEQESAGENAPIVRYLRQLPVNLRWHLEGRELLMVHGSPPDSVMAGIRLLDEDGQLIDAELEAWDLELRLVAFDLLVVGHTHQVFAERLGSGLVVNPGSTVFNHTCAIVDLTDMKVEFHALEGKQPLLAWNWSMLGRA